MCERVIMMKKGAHRGRRYAGATVGRAMAATIWKKFFSMCARGTGIAEQTREAAQ